MHAEQDHHADDDAGERSDDNGVHGQTVPAE